MAAPGFGFSVGDFIAGVSLVKKLVRALNDAAGSRAAYRKLISELLNLEEALTQIGNLQLSPAQESQKLVLLRIAKQCETSIETFLLKNAKFKDSLGAQPSVTLSTWRTNLHKIQWALCKDTAVDDLRIEIAAHAAALNITLATIQVSVTKLHEERLDNCMQILQAVRDETKSTNARVEQNHETLAAHTGWMETMSRTIACVVSAQQGNKLLSFVQMAVQWNIKIFDAVVQTQQLLRSIPPQIERQQPVIFEDAHGRITPVHIEFINSFEAFQAVLVVRFQNMPGLRKVRNLEYSMQDARSQEILDLSKPWENNFRPGRKLVMSIIFQRERLRESVCPGCSAEKSEHEESEGSVMQCDNPDCKLVYRRITPVKEPQRQERGHENSYDGRAKTGEYDREKAQIFGENEERILEFRRVQIHNTEGGGRLTFRRLIAYMIRSGNKC